MEEIPTSPPPPTEQAFPVFSLPDLAPPPSMSWGKTHLPPPPPLQGVLQAEAEFRLLIESTALHAWSCALLIFSSFGTWIIPPPPS